MFCSSRCGLFSYYFLCLHPFFLLGSAITKSGNKQISVVLFGSTVTTAVDFRDSANGLGYLQDKILDMTHRKEGSTATGDALTYVKNKVLGKVYRFYMNGLMSLFLLSCL